MSKIDTSTAYKLFVDMDDKGKVVIKNTIFSAKSIESFNKLEVIWKQLLYDSCTYYKHYKT